MNVGSDALPELRRREHQRETGPAYLMGGALLGVVYVYIAIWFMFLVFA